MIPSLLRPMLPSETSLVLSDWKRDVRESNPGWGASLRAEEWWALVNYTVDRISLPSAKVWMACHRDEPAVPLAWMATRDGLVLHSHAKASVQDEPDLAARLYRELIDHTGAVPSVWSPFEELKNHGNRQA